MINQRIIERHAELVAALWARRCSAAKAFDHTLRDLVSLDARIDANLDALAIAGPDGLAVCEATLKRESRAGTFVLAYLALRLGAAAALEQLLSDGIVVGEPRRGFLDALAFVPEDAFSARLGLWLTASDRQVQAFAIAAACERGSEPGVALEGEWPLESALWLESAAQTVGRLGFTRRLPSVYPLLEHPDPQVRFAAAVTTLRLRGLLRERALAVVDQAAQDAAHPHHLFALTFAVREGDQEAPARYAQLKGAAAFPSRHLGAAAAGTVSAIEELVVDCQNPELSRTAANAFALVTGVDLAYADLEGREPSAPNRSEQTQARASDADDLFAELQDTGDDGNDEEQPGDDLMWVDGERLEQWWRAARDRFARDQRYLGGLPITVEGLGKVLKSGSQQARYEAAWELAVREHGPIVNTLAPGHRQLRGA